LESAAVVQRGTYRSFASFSLRLDESTFIMIGVRSITVNEAQNRLGEIIDEVLNGTPVVVKRGRERVLLRACGSPSQEREWAEFSSVFLPAPSEPKGAVARIRSAIKRVRRAR
jgi:hypothetical protein